ncbi:TRAP transporter substrate-binding protein [Ruegeria pomeroyi]|nr:TRAP transporter substrate-binding protein [Ruegeria pomeroyi]
MNRTLLAAASAITLTAMVGSASAKTIIKVATIAPPETPWTASLEEWKAKVAEASNGEIEIQIFPSAQLGNEYQTYKQVQRGRLDAAALSGSVITEEVPEMALMSTPFLFRNSEIVYCVYDNPDMREKFAGLIEAGGVKFLDYVETGWVHVYAKDDLSNVEDAENYKIRVGPNAISRNFWSSVGANGVEIPYAESFAALQTDLVKGGESADVSFVAFGLGKVAPHFVKTYHEHLGGALILSNKLWDSLTPEERKIISENVQPISDFRAAVTGAGAYLLGKYVEGGGPVHELTEEQRAAWEAKVKQGWDQFVKDLGPGAEAFWPEVLAAKEACES